MAEASSVIEDLMPNNDEIHIIKGIVECLDPINKISKCLSSDQGPTINLVILKIYNLKKRLDQIGNRIPLTVVTKVAEAILVRFENRFPDCGNKVIEYSMSHFLDPRYKGAIIFAMNEARYKDVKIAAAQGILEMPRKDALGSPTSSASSSPLTDLLNDFADNDASTSALKMLYGSNPTKPIEKNCSFTEAKCEVALYCEEGLVPEDSDILEYWKTNRKKFPLLGRLARKFLCIPASSATSEQVFSRAGNAVSEQRTNLSIDNIEMLVYMKKNMKELKTIPDFIWPRYKDNDE